MRQICISNLSIIHSDNGLSPGQCRDIIWTNAGTMLIGKLGTNFNEIISKTHKFSFKKMHLKILSVKWQPFCFGLNVLTPTKGCGNMGYWPRTHLKLKTCVFPLIVAQLSDCLEILYRAWQWHCHALCKISKWLGNWNGCYELIKFLSKLSFGGIPYVTPVPWRRNVNEITAEAGKVMSDTAW